MTEHKPRIFLCHASDDKARVKKLYHQLKDAGYHPWLDKEDLLPGQSWWAEIKRIISDPYNLVVICLSCNSVTKRGTVQREIKRALDVLEEMPEDTIYLIPARLERCEVPERLAKLHWVDLFEPDGFEKLRQAIDFELGRRERPSQPFEPEMILIPAGEFLMGSDPKKDKYAFDNEQPQHPLYLPDYCIAKTLVTNAQYLAFVQATGYEKPRHWNRGKLPHRREDHPVVWVTWHNAVAYCNWLAETTGKRYRLPSEAEWEKGARGTDGRIYSWGPGWDAKRCNTRESSIGETTPVGTHSDGTSPYDLLDMAGNVWEWTRSLWGKDWEEPDFKYPYNPDDGRENLEAGGDVLRVARGGSWLNSQRAARCAYRGRDGPVLLNDDIGFRVCLTQRQG